MNKILKTRAFTLIEVLVVTAVISLLASVVTTSVSESRVEAEDKAKIQEVNQVRNAIEIQRNKTGSVPQGSISSSYTAYNEQSSEYQEAMGELVTSGSMSEVPRSNSGKDYYYLVDDSGNGVFGAILESDTSISDNNGCYFSDPNVGCSGDNVDYTTEFDRGSLVDEGNSCSEGSCGEVVDNSAASGWSGHQGVATWDNSSSACQNLSLNGNDDWRLPTITELQNAYNTGVGSFNDDSTSITLSASISAEEGNPGSYYWTSSVEWADEFGNPINYYVLNMYHNTQHGVARGEKRGGYFYLNYNCIRP